MPTEGTQSYWLVLPQWIIVTFAGFAAATMVGLNTGLFTSIAAGLVAGSLQYVILMTDFIRPFRWIILSSIGWIAALVIGVFISFLMGGFTGPTVEEDIIIAGIIGFVYGAVQCLFFTEDKSRALWIFGNGAGFVFSALVLNWVSPYLLDLMSKPGSLYSYLGGIELYAAYGSLSGIVSGSLLVILLRREIIRINKRK